MGGLAEARGVLGTCSGLGSPRTSWPHGLLLGADLGVLEPQESCLAGRVLQAEVMCYLEISTSSLTHAGSDFTVKGQRGRDEELLKFHFCFETHSSTWGWCVRDP